MSQHIYVDNNNECLNDYIGDVVDAKVVKVQWDNLNKCPTIIYEFESDNTELVVDRVTDGKRYMYLRMFHAKNNTIDTAMHRTNSTLQLSLAACFGYVAKYYDIHALLRPYRIDHMTIGVEVVKQYERRR